MLIILFLNFILNHHQFHLLVLDQSLVMYAPTPTIQAIVVHWILHPLLLQRMPLHFKYQFLFIPILYKYWLHLIVLIILLHSIIIIFFLTNFPFLLQHPLFLIYNTLLKISTNNSVPNYIQTLSIHHKCQLIFLFLKL